MKPDSLIFDMDGTLWDNIDTYVVVWNRGLKAMGYDFTVSREKLMALMGKEPSQLLDDIFSQGSLEQQRGLFDEVVEQYRLYEPEMKPVVFDGVRDGLQQLSEKYKILLLSNCEAGGLDRFMNYTDTRRFVTDYTEFGQNFKPKDVNLHLLKERNGLNNPVYVGDTDSDARSTAKAGLPFVWVSYGFGTTDNYSLKFDSFVELCNYYDNLK